MQSLLTAKKISALRRFQSRQSGRLDALNAEVIQLEQELDTLGRENEFLEHKLHAAKLEMQSKKSRKTHAQYKSPSLLIVGARGKRVKTSSSRTSGTMTKKYDANEQSQISENITHVMKDDDDFSLSD